jgi:putative intracellular protease/amidase
MSQYDEKIDSKDYVSTDKQRVLMVCTSVTKSSWGSSTGLWFEELSTPYYIFKEAGYHIDICSTNGEFNLIFDLK